MIIIIIALFIGVSGRFVSIILSDQFLELMGTVIARRDAVNDELNR